MKSFICILTLAVILVLTLASCSPAPSTVTVTPTATTPTAAPTTTIITTPINADSVNSIVAANTAFALDLYQQLKMQQGNLFLSPYSISAALAMTSAGARGDTLAQMLAVLHYGNDSQVNELFSQLDALLKSRSQNVEVTVYNSSGSKKETVDGFTLNIINALWGQQDYHFLQEYLTLIDKYYGGALHEVDFINDPEQARLEINQWASDHTNGRIKDLLAPGAVNNLTRLVLTNAIYFNAHWLLEFSESNTTPEKFYLLDGSDVTVPMMRQTLNYSYADTAGCQALSLPYLGGDLDMVVLLPEEGRFEQFEDGLDAGTLNAILAAMKQQEIKVSLPKFSFSSEFNLNEALKALGMTDAFNGSADFSGITGSKELSISDVIHKSFIAVDEHGTEAAAVTAVIMAMAMPPADIPAFNANHPFIFLIRDIQTGSILFMGRVMNPGA